MRIVILADRRHYQFLVRLGENVFRDSSNSPSSQEFEPQNDRLKRPRMGKGVQIIVYMGMQDPAAERINRVVSKPIVVL
jgi:hypothetical protein